VILYELMTGEKPFPGQNITTVIYKIINEEPIPPRSLDSSIHPGLSTVITRALRNGEDGASHFAAFTGREPACSTAPDCRYSGNSSLP
jgi:hypothetical protein